MGDYKYLDHTADEYIEASGSSIEDSFESAALGFSNVITDLESVDASKAKTVEIESKNLKSLLFDFMSELIYLNEVDNFVFSKVDVKISDDSVGYKLEATLKGEPFDSKKHESGTVVKGITYHDMEVIEEDGKVILRFLLDI